MKEIIRRTRAERAGNDGGFTLIELLVVVVIIGVLVAIAIPLYSNYREGAEKKSAQADVRGAIPAIEQCYVDNSYTYPASAGSTGPGDPVDLICGTSPQTLNVSPGNELTYTLGAGGTYTVAVENTNTGTVFTYSSTTGQVAESVAP
jgi:type IV pilus assembly protein PilA